MGNSVFSRQHRPDEHSTSRLTAHTETNNLVAAITARPRAKVVTAIALAITLGLASTALIAPSSAIAVTTDNTVSQNVSKKDTTPVGGDSVDYIADEFPEVGANSVFDVVTYERLVKSVLRQDGKSIIVLGSPRNASTKAALPTINAAAKAKGIQKIYFVDPHLAGDEGKDGDDIVWDSKDAATQKTLESWKLWDDGAGNGLKNFDAKNKTAQLKYADNTYTSADTLLLVFDRNGGADSANTVATQTLLTDKDAEATASNPAGYEQQVNKVFDDSGVSGGHENRFNQYDFFTNAFASATPKVNEVLGDDYYRAHPEAFKLQSVTAAELIHILKTPGKHNVLVSGSWCGDSKHAIGYISEDATRFDSGPVYVFDFRTDGYVQGLKDSYFSGDTAGKKPSSGWIGNEILTLFGKNLRSGTANGATSAYPDGDSTKQPVEGPKRVRSPFLAQITTAQANQAGEVTRDWIHVLQNYEKPWNYWITDKDYGIGPDVKAGDLLDYELYSGVFTDAQRALGRAAIGEFFSGTSMQSAGNPNPPQAYVARGDSGCGDTNDALDNVPGDKLLPYQGTDVYDVKNYDIAVNYDPSAADQKSNIAATTTLTATAKTNLKAISLDFREQQINKQGVTVKTADGKAITVNNISGVHNYNVDDNKVTLHLNSTIAKGSEFQVSIPYSTGIIDAFLADGQQTQGFFKTTDGNGIAVLGEPLGSTYWFPDNNTPSDGATYTVSLTAPSDYTSVSAGVRQSITPNSADGTSTTVWKVSKETAPYQEFAYISKNTVTLGDSDNQNGGGAQQISVSDGKGGTKVIPGLSFVNKTTYDKNDNRNRDKADTYFNKLPYYISELEKIAGAYPGESAGFVFDDLSDGTGASASGIGLEGKDRPVLAGANFTDEQTLIHEYVHQWFGDTARPAGWEDLWLNEAFATYITDQYYENTSGLDVQAKWKKLYDTTDASNDWWKYPVTGDKDEADLFGGASAVYNRGAVALAALRDTIGDEKFKAIESTWIQEHQGQAVTTDEFVKFASQKSGVDLNDWAKTWLYSTSKPAAWPGTKATEPNNPGNGNNGNDNSGQNGNGNNGQGNQNGNTGGQDNQNGNGNTNGNTGGQNQNSSDHQQSNGGTNHQNGNGTNQNGNGGKNNAVRNPGKAIKLSSTGSATFAFVLSALGLLGAGIVTKYASKEAKHRRE